MGKLKNRPFVAPDRFFFVCVNNNHLKLILSYELYLPEEHEFIPNQFLPSLYHNGPTNDFRQTRIKMNNGNLEMNTNKCDFCSDVNAAGGLGTVTKGRDRRTALSLD